MNENQFSIFIFEARVAAARTIGYVQYYGVPAQPIELHCETPHLYFL